ncbi:MAG: aminoacyl-tRNA hydrolase, partial [Dehalococcoidia bacterium]|nr:aminoacyl-tRNA hydrolase [Dehalococcoidia bacterium]
MRFRRALRLGRKKADPAAWLVVGLGNPGEQYSRNRHNAGAWTVNELARRLGTQLKAQGRSIRIGYGEIGGERVALVRPRTYVNESGRAVDQALRACGAELEQTIVVYDELDLPLGAVRLREGGGAGGHNGLKSIIAETSSEFARVRIGIGRPQDGNEPTRDPDLVADYVLTDPVGEERATLE